MITIHYVHIYIDYQNGFKSKKSNKKTKLKVESYD